jgi:hypothetical protein
MGPHRDGCWLMTKTAGANCWCIYFNALQIRLSESITLSHSMRTTCHSILFICASP